MEVFGKPPQIEDLVSLHSDLGALDADDHDTGANAYLTQARYEAAFADSIDAYDFATDASVNVAIDDNINDHIVASPAHSASKIAVVDAADNFLSGELEGVTTELADADAAIASDVTALDVRVTTAEADIDALEADVADIVASGDVPTTRALTAGVGLSGGGDLTADRSFAVNVDEASLEIVADALQVRAGGITTSHVASETLTNANISPSAAIEAAKIAIADAAGDFDATNVETALAELQSDAEAHLADATDAHDASAISLADAGGQFVATNVEDALAEIVDGSAPINVRTSALVMEFDGGGAAIEAGAATPPLYVPFNCTITGCHIQSDVSGSIVVDLLKDAGTNPPTTSLCGAGTKPTLSSQDQASTSLTSWTTSVAAGDFMRGSVSGTPSTVTQVTVVLTVTKDLT